MPEMDGFEATARTRIRVAGRGPIPIMAMIADAVEAALERWLMKEPVSADD